MLSHHSLLPNNLVQQTSFALCCQAFYRQAALTPQALLAARVEPTYLELTHAQLPADLQLHHHGGNRGQHHCFGVNGVR